MFENGDMWTVGAIATMHGKAILSGCRALAMKIKETHLLERTEDVLHSAGILHNLTDASTLSWMISPKIRKQKQHHTFDRGEHAPSLPFSIEPRLLVGCSARRGWLYSRSSVYTANSKFKMAAKQLFSAASDFHINLFRYLMFSRQGLLENRHGGRKDFENCKACCVSAYCCWSSAFYFWNSRSCGGLLLDWRGMFWYLVRHLGE